MSTYSSARGFARATPRLPQPLTPQSLQGLMRESAYWDATHPRFPTYQRLVKRGFEILYPGPVTAVSRAPSARRDDTGMIIDVKPLPSEQVAHLVEQTNREMDAAEGFNEKPGSGKTYDGAVHVEAHTRDSGKVEVSDYWRAAPGQGAGHEGADKGGSEFQERTGEDRSQSVSPVPNPEMRNDPEGLGHFGANRKSGPHKGIDILANPGDEVVSPVDRTVDRITPAYPDPKYKGLETVVIKDDDREYKFLYVTPKDNEGKASIKKGDRVNAGDPIGTVQDRAAYDRTGNMKNHIHIEIRDKSGQPIDPTPHFKRWRNESAR